MVLPMNAVLLGLGMNRNVVGVQTGHPLGFDFFGFWNLQFKGALILFFLYI